jgi:hypothetical protein
MKKKMYLLWWLRNLEAVAVGYTSYEYLYRHIGYEYTYGFTSTYCNVMAESQNSGTLATPASARQMLNIKSKGKVIPV